MCGIVGFWELNKDREGMGNAINTMLDTLEHRGPDGKGIHLDKETGLAMGHTRLSIIDLQTGNQPLYGNNRKLVLTVNGEFYDYKRHRANLACDGIRLHTKTDTEIAIPFYQQDDLQFVHRLRGEFAIALFDYSRKQLVLVRDRFGIKPLYYRITNDAIYYGSEVKAVLAHPRVPRELCPYAAIHQMMQVMVPGSTAFSGIEALQPGHALVVQQNGDHLQARQIPYWDMEFPHKNDHDSKPDCKLYVDRVRELLIDSVATRLEADVPVGCYLSGGIDSCSILGLATSLQQSPVKAFTISFDHADYDEAAIANHMAEKTRADQELLQVTASELYGDYFAKVAWHTERTFYNTLSVAKWHMSRRVRQCGFKVVITGEGADELFAGYPFFKRDMFLHGDDCQDEQLTRMAKTNSVFAGAILSDTQQSHPAWNDLCGFTPSWLQPWMLTLQACTPLFSTAVRDLLASYDPITALAQSIDADKVRNRHPLDIAQYTWSKTMLEGQILTWGGDRVDMANSMESRPCFPSITTWQSSLCAFPLPSGIRNGIDKWVLREAMKGVLPEVLYKREKFAFMAPPSHTDPTKTNAVQELIDNWLTPERINQAGLFDHQSVQDFLTNSPDSANHTLSRRRDIILNHLLQTHILHHHFVNREALASSV